MKIIIKIPVAQEQKVKDAFTAYSNLMPTDQTKNIEQNVLGFVQNVYKGMEGAKQVQVIVNTGATAIQAVPAEVQTDANKLSVESNAL